MKKTCWFLILYIFAVIQRIRYGEDHPPPGRGIGGKCILFFRDSHRPETGWHSVVAFVLPKGQSVSPETHSLWGPFGYEETIDLFGWHLYGLDTWGTVDQAQISWNKELDDLANQYPDRTIQLAGVRSFLGHHPWPLNRPERFRIVGK